MHNGDFVPNLNTNERSRDLSVIPPGLNDFTRVELPRKFESRQVELLRTIRKNLWNHGFFM